MEKKSKPVKDKAPLPSCNKERLVASIKQQRLQCKDLESQLVGMKKEIYSDSIEINKSLKDDILNILGNSDLKSTPHMNLFLATTEEASGIFQVWSKLSSPPDQILSFPALQITFCIPRAGLLWCFGIAK